MKEDLNATLKDGSNKNDMRKMYEILKRIREADEGLDTGDFDFDGLDSDDDEDSKNEHEDLQEIEEEEEDEDIAERLKDIDINDADEVWKKLTLSEKEEFKNLVSTGDIMKFIPHFQPWWMKKNDSKIVVLTSDKKEQSSKPTVIENIRKYSSICSKEPAPSLHFNLWNILAAYSCTVRYFNGEHLTTPNEATAYLVNLSAALKYGTNFEDVEDAVISVEIEALTTGNGATQLMPTSGVPNSLLVEDRSRLKADTRQLMATLTSKLSALSDILRLLRLTKKSIKSSNENEEFQKLFALSSGMDEITLPKIKLLVKKLEFYLSYVDRENN